MVQTPTFSAWLRDLRDRDAIVAITRRLQRFASGLFGDVKPVGEGVMEARVDVGAGYRAYYIRRGARIVVLLCGGDKGSQNRDILRARRLADELDEQ